MFDFIYLRSYNAWARNNGQLTQTFFGAKLMFIIYCVEWNVYAKRYAFSYDYKKLSIKSC